MLNAHCRLNYFQPCGRLGRSDWFMKIQSRVFKIELVVVAVDVNQHHLIRLNTNFALQCYVTSPRLRLWHKKNCKFSIGPAFSFEISYRRNKPSHESLTSLKSTHIDGLIIVVRLWVDHH